MDNLKKERVKPEVDRPVSIFDAVVIPLLVNTKSDRFDRPNY